MLFFVKYFDAFIQTVQCDIQQSVYVKPLKMSSFTTRSETERTLMVFFQYNKESSSIASCREILVLSCFERSVYKSKDSLRPAICFVIKVTLLIVLCIHTIFFINILFKESEKSLNVTIIFLFLLQIACRTIRLSCAMKKTKLSANK